MIDQGHAVEVVELGTRLFRTRMPGHRFAVREVEESGDFRTINLMRWLAVLGHVPADVCVLAKGGLNCASLQLDLAARLRFPTLITFEHLCPDTRRPRGRGRHFGGLVPGVGLWWIRQRVKGCARWVMPDKVICVSHAVRDALVGRFFFPRAKTRTVHNGVDVDRFRPDPVLRAAVRGRWNASPDSFVFGAVGRLDHVKGYDVAIRAFSNLCRKYPSRDLRLVLVGEGEARESLARLAGDLGVRDRVTLPGFSNRTFEELPGLDVFVMPSRAEGLPLSLVEALACGCCAIATTVGGNAEVLSSPDFGWLVQPEDENAFLNGMEAALRCGASQIAEMGVKAREHVVARFNARTQFVLAAEAVCEPRKLNRIQLLKYSRTLPSHSPRSEH